MSHVAPFEITKGPLRIAVDNSPRPRFTVVASYASDAELVGGLYEGAPCAARALYDRYGELIFRVLRRLVGDCGEVQDLAQEVLLQAVRDIRSLHDRDRLKSWLSGIAVFTARAHLRRLARRRRLREWFHAELLEAIVPPPCASMQQVARHTYAILERMPVDDRIAFTLRMIEQMQLEDVARACRISLATAKRRIARAQGVFLAEAEADPVLLEWLKTEGACRS